MAVVKMTKFTLLTFDRHKSALLKELQRFEDVHFKNLKDLLESDLSEVPPFLNKYSSEEAARDAEAELSKVSFAIAKTQAYSTGPKGLKALTRPPRELSYDEFDAFPKTYDYNGVYARLKDCDEQINEINAEISKRTAENEQLRPWLRLDADFAALDRSKHVKYVVGAINKLQADGFQAGLSARFPAAYLEFIGNIKDDSTVLLVAPSGEFDDCTAYAKTMGFSKLTLNFKGIPEEIVNKNNDAIAKLRKRLAKIQENIKELGGQYDRLTVVSDYYESALARERAGENFLKTRYIFMAEGWIPEAENKRFRDIVAAVCGSEYYLNEEPAAPDSGDVPIKLKNNKVVSAFEDITSMFSMPRYNEIDPTPLLMPFYMLSFGLMVGDAGYGLVMLAVIAAALKFLHFKPSMQKFLKFFFYLSFGTILGGLVYGSAFGLTFFAPIPTGGVYSGVFGLPLQEGGTYKAILDTQADVVTMLIASVGIGVIQILFGLGVKGYALLRGGKVFAAIFDSLFLILALLSAVGWLIGGVGLLPEPVAKACPWILLITIIGLASTQGRENKTIVGKVAGGVYSVYGLTSYIGDFVSYTRIAALALSGAYIAFSFNLMSTLLPEGIVRWVAGSLIFLIGQSLNLGLALLGAYVHSCRLQYVEYFGKFFEGGGVPFSAFKLKNKYVSIKKQA